MAVPRHEIAAAQAVKLLKLLMAEAEHDSCGDPFKALKLKLAAMDPIADAILGQQTWCILDDAAYLVNGTVPKRLPM